MPVDYFNKSHNSIKNEFIRDGLCLTPALVVDPWQRGLSTYYATTLSRVCEVRDRDQVDVRNKHTFFKTNIYRNLDKQTS